MLYLIIFALRVAREIPSAFDAFDLFQSNLFSTLKRCTFSISSKDISSVISNISCHQEIYGDSVQYFDPYNKKDIAQKINLVLTDGSLKQKLIQKGYEAVKKFNWEETARITLDVFEKA